MALASTSAQGTPRGRTACVAHSKQHATTCKATSRQLQSLRRPQQFRRPTPACRAEERSRDSTKTSEAERLRVPDMPPAKDSSRTSDVGYEATACLASRHRPILTCMQEETSTSQAQSSDISDELRALQQRKRQQSESAAPTGYIQVSQPMHQQQLYLCVVLCSPALDVLQSILQEVRLIEWPTPKQVCNISCSTDQHAAKIYLFALLPECI